MNSNAGLGLKKTSSLRSKRCKRTFLIVIALIGLVCVQYNWFPRRFETADMTPVQGTGSLESVHRSEVPFTEANRDQHQIPPSIHVNLDKEENAKVETPESRDKPEPAVKPENVERSAVILTTMATGDMPMLRELVGSIHSLRGNNIDVHTVIVYGFGLTTKETREISLWRNVEYIDGFEALFLGQRSIAADEDVVPYPDPQVAKHSPVVLLNMIEMNLRRYGLVLYVRNNIKFTGDSVHQIADLVFNNGVFFSMSSEEKQAVETELSESSDNILHAYLGSSVMGFRFGSKSSLLFISFQLQCLRGYHCDSVFLKKLIQSQKHDLANNMHSLDEFKFIPYDQNKPGGFCSLLLRDDILYSFEYGSSQHDNNHGRDLAKLHETRSRDPSNKITVAIGMPTLSVTSLQSFKEVSPIRIFFPSFLKNIKDDEWKRFKYYVYVGFDEGDRFFDHVDSRKQIDEELNKFLTEHVKGVAARLGITEPKAREMCEVVVEYIKFPYNMGWVTYLWNGLFVHAIKDGADYFFQVNDDLAVESSGWTSVLVDKLREMNDIGVVGPIDNNRGGDTLLTQAFVSWKHYQIFGRMYPLDIKDWFSDNWITDVYESRRFTLKDAAVRNVNDKGTRYHICMQPRYHEILNKGKQILKDWLDDEEATTPEMRLEQELHQGPLVQ